MPLRSAVLGDTLTHTYIPIHSPTDYTDCFLIGGLLSLKKKKKEKILNIHLDLIYDFTCKCFDHIDHIF